MYVYFLTELGGDFCTKIGITTNLENRISNIQNGNPNKLHLTMLLKTKKYASLEQQLHRFFKDKGKHIHREWFYLTDNDLSDVRNMYKAVVDQFNPLPQVLKEHKAVKRKTEQYNKLKFKYNTLLERHNQMVKCNWETEYELYLEVNKLRQNDDCEQVTKIYFKLRDMLGLTNNEYVLLSYIYNSSNKLSNISWVCTNQSNLAEKVGVSRRSINEMIKRLVAKGLLKKEKVSNLGLQDKIICSVSDKWINAYLKIA